MSNFFTIFGGRRAKWIVLAVWLIGIFAIIGANLPGKFSDAESNESTSFLPGDAESTKTLEATEELQNGEQAAIVIVYRREGGLTEADQQKIAADREELNALKLRATSPFAEPTPSEDGSGALVIASITSDGESDTLLDPVDEVRERVSDPGGGLEVKVTGPAGFSADAIKVFESINGTLLLAAVGIVFVLLILIYRSPVFFWIPLFAVICAEIATRGVGYALTELGVTVNGQSSSILSVLVLGAGTDYALLLVSRYREELRRHEDKHEAMRLALRTAGPAIFASGLTVMAALLCLSIAELNGTAGLGPVGAMGIGVAMVAMLTLLPALLVIFGRRAFWPFIPHYGDVRADETRGFWRRLGDRVAVRPRQVWVATTALLLVFALGLLNFSDGLTQGNSFTGDVESVEGQELLAQSFPGGANAPTDIIVPDQSKVQAVTAAVQEAPGVAEVRPVTEGPPGAFLQAVLTAEPFTTEAFAFIPGIREAAKAAGGPETLVGGATATEYDVRQSAARDTRVIVPIALVVVLLILMVLLRAVLGPVLLVLTTILSFLAALGVGAVVFDVLFGFPGSDPSLPLFSFIFLVALGIDYNIFLMTRAREETFRHGTRQGMIRALAVTGGVITAAGLVLAGTFSVLAVLPLVFLTEIGFVIAFGVLLDTFIVRSVLVPAIVLDTGSRFWWPSKLWKTDGGADAMRQPEAVAAGADGDRVGNGRLPSGERVGE